MDLIASKDRLEYSLPLIEDLSKKNKKLETAMTKMIFENEFRTKSQSHVHNRKNVFKHKHVHRNPHRFHQHEQCYHRNDFGHIYDFCP